MNKIKFLKNNYIQLNQTIYKPHSICELPERFGLVDEDGAYGVDIDENINKMKTQQLATKLRTEVDRYRTFNLRKCKTRRVFLETNYKQLPKKQIQQLEDMAEINED